VLDQPEELLLNPLLETQRAFDAVADSYADSNAANPVLEELRRRTLDAVRERVLPSARLLDLGCGPGVDAESFGREGYRVLATDWSPEMVRAARKRIVSAGLASRVEVRHVGIQELDRLEGRTFDAAYSNLGPLNCVPDLSAAARRIGKRLEPGGFLVASVIGRVCPWEIALYGLRRDWERMRVRFSRKLVPVPFYGRTVWTRYYSPAEVEAAFVSAGFELVSLRSLGLLLPPPYLTGFATRHRRWVETLGRAEERIASWPGIRQWGDHFLIVMRKRPLLEPEDAYRLWAPRYPSFPHNELMRVEQEAMEPLIRSARASRALDVGTGTGRYLRVLRAAGVPIVFGLDRSHAMLDGANGAAPLVRADATSAPFAPGSFDLVVASLMVGDVEDLEGWAREMSRLLGSKGSLVYSDFHPLWAERGFERTFRDAYGEVRRVRFHPHSFADHRGALAHAGLEVVELRELASNAGVVLRAVKLS
jgi:SAM-dependent methyltransferase